MNKSLPFLSLVLTLNVSYASVKSADEPGNLVVDSLTILEVPRIDFIEMSENQPQKADPATIWYDDFSTTKKYMDGSGKIDTVNFGTQGGSLDMGFDKGDVNGNGNRKVAFGDYPGGGAVRAGEQFDDVYWRIYVKHEYGWEGSPAKMSRATSLVSHPGWRQAMIAHVWSGANNSLTLDPARGVDGQTDQVKTTKYNDFDNLFWLGNKPTSNFQISDTKESGYWVLVESRAKLNTPGKSDGINQLWIDGRLEAERKNLNFRGSYTAHGINAVFLESYWNSGALKTEGRWFDNFVVSTKPIGPVVCSSNAVLHKTPYKGPNTLSAWEVELASDYDGVDVVFKSQEINGTEVVAIEQGNGIFLGSLTGKSALASGKTYFCRVRQKSSNGALSRWSDWSRWHQGFVSGELLSSSADVSLSTPDVALYPNPANTTLTITGGMGLTEKAAIEIYTLQGTKVYQTSDEVSLPQHVVLSAYVPGVYLVKVSIGGKYFTQKIVIKKQ